MSGVGRFCWPLVLALSLLMAGCASTIRTEVTAFNQWPADAAGRSFGFVHRDSEAQDLARQTYEHLVRAQLRKLGLKDAMASETAQLSVRLDYAISGRDVRVVETVLVDPWVGTPWYGSGFFHPYWGMPGSHPYFHGPMFPGPPVAREREMRFTVFRRELKLTISDTAGGRALYDVTVVSEGEQGNLALLMPYLVEAAFRDFPGLNGAPRVIEMKMAK